MENTTFEEVNFFVLMLLNKSMLLTRFFKKEKEAQIQKRLKHLRQ